MEIIILENMEEAGRKAASIVASTLRRENNPVIGLATGSTPLPLYRELIRLHKEECLDFSDVTTFNLDEYVGLSPDHPASYNYFMWQNLLDHVNIRREKVNIPNGLTEDIPAFCKDYEGKIAEAGGLDIQILGIGGDGHIAFNEPSSSLASRTRIKTLTRETIKDNSIFFEKEEDIPRHVITMGVGTIMESRRCLLMAFGEKKAEAVRKMVEGPITAMVPASVLQMHESAIVIVDEAAASLLERKDYYKWVYNNKPDWQKH